jgi:hypothetical protein
LFHVSDIWIRTSRPGDGLFFKTQSNRTLNLAKHTQQQHQYSTDDKIEIKSDTKKSKRKGIREDHEREIESLVDKELEDLVYRHRT